MLRKTFGKEKRWVNWNYQTKDGKKTKVPIGSSTDETTWSTYNELNQSLPKGIVFTPDKNLLGVDIDSCVLDGFITHEKKDVIEVLIEQADTYVELSPSKKGLHIFLKVSEPLTLVANKKSPFECYTSGRFFTVTGESFGEEKEIRTVSIAEAISILSIIGYPWGKEITNVSPKLSPISSISDGDILNKMFTAKNGDKIKAIYDGDISSFKNDESSADASICSHLAFWTNGNSSQIERIWLASPLGQRQKTQKRPDYRNRTIDFAVKNCKEFYTPHVEEKEIDFLFTMSGKDKSKVYTLNTENMCRILREHSDFKGKLRYDTFRNVIEIKDGEWRETEDNDAVRIQTQISILFSFFQKVGKDMVYDSLIKVAKENSIDSALDFVKSIKWDGVDRLNSWLTHTYGVPNNKLHKAIGSNWLKGLVKRIVYPGCKFDYVLVLEGEQGSKKSTSLATLGRNWHVETTMSTDTKDFFMQFQGKAIVEFSEGETLSRTEVKRMKAIITMQFDKYRPPYERTSRDFPRRCVFAMTTNQSEYLKDETGNRRWLPIRVVLPQANIEWLENNRDQLFAEAYHRVVNLKEKVYEFPEEEMLEAQQARRIKDPNNDLIVDWYYNKLTFAQREEGITIAQVYRDVLNGGFASRAMEKYQEMNIASVLKETLKLNKEQVMKNKIRMVRWYDRNNTEPQVLTRDEMLLDMIEKF